MFQRGVDKRLNFFILASSIFGNGRVTGGKVRKRDIVESCTGESSNVKP